MLFTAALIHIYEIVCKKRLNLFFINQFFRKKHQSRVTRDINVDKMLFVKLAFLEIKLYQKN